MATELKYEFKVDLKPVRHKSSRYHMAKISNEPRLRQYLVLAYQIQETLEHDNTITAKKIAGWINMTPARISQILRLLLLAPAIQEKILLSTDEKIRKLTEFKIKNISSEIIWKMQLIMWDELLKIAQY